MWAVYRTAETLKQRPSDLIGLADLCRQVLGGPSSWLAWCVDQAVVAFGTHVEAKLLETVGEGAARRPKHTLAALLKTRAERQQESLAEALKRGYVVQRSG